MCPRDRAVVYATPVADEHYRNDALDPDHRFDRVETTVSHLLREPHSALGGRAYGPALLDGLDARGMGPGPGGVVVEVGGGAGWLAAACLRARPGLSWWGIDLSRPALHAQRHRAARADASVDAVGYLRGDAEHLPLRDGSVAGLLLANEVIADLAVEADDNGHLVGTGAANFVREIARVLAPGGRAALVEFGGDSPVVAAPMWGDLGRGDHTEHTIDFPALVEVASTAGLTARTERLFDILHIDESVRVASYSDLRRLSALVPSTPMIAVTEEELRRRHPFLTKLLAFDFPRLSSRRFPDAHGSVGAAEAFEVLLLTAAPPGA